MKSRTADRRPEPSWSVWLPVNVLLALPVLLATVGLAIVGFDIGTTCTEPVACAPTRCTPCAGSGRLLVVAELAQIVLLVIGCVLAVGLRRGWRPGPVRSWAVALAVVSPVSFAVFAELAVLAT